MDQILHLIDGEWVPSASTAEFPDVNPWTQEQTAVVAEGGEAEADRALAAARRAFDEGPWPRMTPEERAATLRRLADLIESNAERIAVADTTDMGKPIADMRSKDIPRGAQNFRYFADYVTVTPSEYFPMASGHHAFTRYEPAGVVAAISPWNYPFMLETWKVAPALAFGNTVVLKPAEDTPRSASILGELALQAGVPAGVLNVVQGFGPASAGEALTRDARVDRITFTGESDTGRAIMRSAAENLVPVSFELGGKGANVVFADADLDSAVAWAVKAGFTNAGQLCIAGSRVFVEQSIHDEFLARLVDAVDSLAIGDPMLEATQIGPLSSASHFRKVSRYLDGVEVDGGKVLRGGARTDGSWVVEPTVVVGMDDRAAVCRDEVFGPVVTVQPFRSEDEVIRRVNDSRYGLNAVLFTESLRRSHRVSAALRAGTVWVNCFFIRELRAPFGGAGDSGIGREGGAHSREFFTEPKAVVMEV